MLLRVGSGSISQFSESHIHNLAKDSAALRRRLAGEFLQGGYSVGRLNKNRQSAVKPITLCALVGFVPNLQISRGSLILFKY